MAIVFCELEKQANFLAISYNNYHGYEMVFIVAGTNI